MSFPCKTAILSLALQTAIGPSASAKSSLPPDSIKIVVEPKLIEKPPLVFPEEARGASVSGKLWIKVKLSVDGRPMRTEILHREPEMAFMFDDVARRWAMQCRFSPAKDSAGIPVSVSVTIPLNFKILDFQPPTVEHLATPEYPEEAVAMGMEGWVGVAVFVDATGSAMRGKCAIVARDPATTTVFDDAAKDAAKSSTYRPALLSGGPVDGWCFVKIEFTLSMR